MIGAALCNDPAPILMVLPQKELAQLVSERRIQPMIRNCPGVTKHSIRVSAFSHACQVGPSSKTGVDILTIFLLPG